MTDETKDSQPTIVFLHGTRLTGAQWAAQVTSLSTEFHCLTPDLPGHGRAADIPFSLEDAARRIAELIDRDANGGRAIVVGLSLGGYVAMAVAARCPEQVAGLAISGATAEPIGPRTVFYRGLAAIFSWVPARVLHAVNRWFFAWRYPAEIATPIITGGFFFEGGAIAVRSLIGERFKPRLAAYPGPSLILNGELDLFFRPTEGVFARAASNVRLVRIRGATHHANLDQPRAFTEAIRRFAVEIDRR
jgi:pimeloyl-ACP methyl ester carboxylesterase